MTCLGRILILSVPVISELGLVHISERVSELQRFGEYLGILEEKSFLVFRSKYDQKSPVSQPDHALDDLHEEVLHIVFQELQLSLEDSLPHRVELGSVLSPSQ